MWIFSHNILLSRYLINREVAHYVLLSRNVNMQRIRFAFVLREVFDFVRYDDSTEEFVRFRPKVFKYTFHVYSNPNLNMSTQL